MVKKVLMCNVCIFMLILSVGCASLGVSNVEPQPIINYYESSVEPQSDDPYYTSDVGGASSVFDGNMYTRWSSQWKDGQWIAVEFADIATIYGLKIYWEDAYSEEYSIQISDDNINWQEVYLQQESEGGIEKIQFEKPVFAKFLRINCEVRATMFGNSIWEAQIWQSKEQMKKGIATD